MVAVSDGPPDPKCGWESTPPARKVLPVILGPELVELICGGVAVLVSTRDSDLQPEIVRAWGPEVSADGSSLTVCVPAPGSRTAANIESNDKVTTNRRSLAIRHRPSRTWFHVDVSVNSEDEE